MTPPTVAQRIAALTAQAEHALLAEARRELRHERERLEAPERTREALAQALAQARTLRQEVQRDVDARALANVPGLDVAEAYWRHGR
jgi:hypothetical protein